MVTRGRTETEKGDREYWNAPEAWGGTAEQKEFELYPANIDVCYFFLDVQTQWSVTTSGERIGLLYSGVESAARLLGFELTADKFRDLQILERVVIRESNAKFNHV